MYGNGARVAMGLETYHRKRDFTRTPEPRGSVSKIDRRRFVVQEHHASALHFDFRLEMGGVLKSWSVRHGPSLDPGVKRLAVPTEDHPVEYLKFQGDIPAGEYGAGRHMIWDAGTYELVGDGDALGQLAAGRLKFRLRGEKLRGEFSLVRFAGGGERWLLIKARDEFAREGWELELLQPEEKKDGAKGAASSERKRDERAAKRAAHARASDAGGKRRGAPAKQPSGPVLAASGAFRARELRGDVNVRIGGTVVALTNLDKIYWPEDGLTKGDLLRYYYQVSKYILPYLKDRPLIMKRYPDGIRGSFFHQHDVHDAPDFVRTVALPSEEGHTVDYAVGDNLATLLHMANLGAIERHPWHSRVGHEERPDWVVFDLDPGEGVEFETICELAMATRDVLAGLGLESYPKTSGSRGVHVYVPVEPAHDYDLVADFAARVAAQVARAHPSRATVERALKKRRRGQIYVDHMQNARGKSVVAPYSVRPRPGATVSAPLTWEEVENRQFTPRDFTIKNMPARLKARGDLFRPMLKGGQRLEGALEKIRSAGKA